MTARQIRRAIRQGQMVVLRSDPWHSICVDLFGDLVVISRRREADFSTRLATLSDKRQAAVFDRSMIRRKNRKAKK